jgi:hypothetical protein
MYYKAAEAVEKIIKNDAGGRGLGDIAGGRDLAKASEELYGSTRVVIITGFCIAETLCGETDGPLGAVTLAGALEKLGKEVMLVTDGYSETILKACAKHAGIKAGVEVLPLKGCRDFCGSLLKSFSPSHVVAIERPGKAVDGRFYSMRGADLTPLIPDSDCLFEAAKERGITTIAIGDGGNELGMGKVRELVARLLELGETIAAVSEADYTIVAGVSNWGAHGLEAMLSILSSRMLLQEEAAVKELIEKMVEAGAVDGCSKKPEPTVDGLSLEQNLEVLRSLRQLTEEYLRKNKD